MTFDHLLEEVNATVKAASKTSLTIGVQRGVREVIRRIGIDKVCPSKEIELHVRENKAELPEDYIGMIDLYAAVFNPDRGKNLGYKISPGMKTEHRLEFREIGSGLFFPNYSNGTVMIEYFFMEIDEDGDLLIPDIIYNACFKYCEYDLLEKSGNTRNPRWQERLIMKQDALTAISDARGDINSTTMPAMRTIRYMK